MTSTGKHRGGETDLGELYRSLGPDTVPRHLDDRVLQLAAREVRSDQRFDWGSWLRPAAATAVVCLSLAFWFEWLDGPGSGEDDATSVVDDFSSAAADSSSRIREIGSTAAAQSADGDPRPAEEAARHCNPVERATPETWQRCIRALDDAGRSSDAADESLALRAAHPEL